VAVCEVTTGQVGLRDCDFAAQEARYVSVEMSAYASTYGASLWELEVYGPAEAPPPALDLSATAQVKCAAGKAYLAVTSWNLSEGTAALSVSTPYGTKVFPAILAGKSGLHAFTTRLPAYDAGEVVVTGVSVGDPSITGEVKVFYAQASCAG
jgi:arabinoxylan arabinofuranohydrolase